MTVPRIHPLTLAIWAALDAMVDGSAWR